MTPTPRLALVGALLLSGCPAKDDSAAPEAEPQLATDLVVTPSEAISTVLRATWSTEVPTRCVVFFGEDTNYAYATPEEAELATAHEALLLGLPASTDAHLIVVCTDEAGTSATTEDQVARTGDLPSIAPSVTRTGEPDPYGGFLAVPVIGSQNLATFLDAQGRVVWWHALTEEGYIAQRVRLSVDGQSVLYDKVWLLDRSEVGAIVRVSLDGSTVEEIPAILNTHDFVEAPDGTIFAIYTDVREVDGEEVIGDSLYELSPDGSSRTFWSAFDEYDPLTEPSLNDSDGNWTHFNHIVYDPSDDSVIVSIRNFNALVKIARASGEVVWRMGGHRSDFRWEGGADPFYGQHGFELLDDGGLLLFNNGTAEEASSHAVAYDVDWDTRTLTQTWRQDHDPELYIWAMGDVERRGDGGTRITWSTAGEIQQYDAAGALESQTNGDFGVVFGYTEWVPGFYPPGG